METNEKTFNLFAAHAILLSGIDSLDDMPSRVLREGIIASEPINSLSERAELFYRRLMSVADDYGRYYAHPSLLRSACFPLLLNRYSDDDVQKMLQECVSAKVLVLYGEGKYLSFVKFGQQTRGKSKFPDPPKHLLIQCLSGDEPSLLTSDPAPNTNTTSHTTPNPSKVEFETFWVLYPRKVAKPKAFEAFTKARKKVEMDKLLAGLEKQKKSEQWLKDGGQFVPHPSTWLNQCRWDDEVVDRKPTNHIDRSIGTANEGLAAMYKGRATVKPENIKET